MPNASPKQSVPVAELILIKTNLAGYFFDAFMDMEHQSDLKITTHPVQLGANVADHAYLEPKKLTMHIKMSDAVASIVPGQFTAGYTRSVSAFLILQELQASRVPFRVHTRLRAYENMLIESLVAPDDVNSLYGLECTVTMKEILVATTQTVKVSKRMQTTGRSDGGVVAVQKVEDESTAYRLNKIAGNPMGV